MNERHEPAPAERAEPFDDPYREVYERAERAIAIAINAGAGPDDIHALCWASGILVERAQRTANKLTTNRTSHG